MSVSPFSQKIFLLYTVFDSSRNSYPVALKIPVLGFEDLRVTHFKRKEMDSAFTYLLVYITDVIIV